MRANPCRDAMEAVLLERGISWSVEYGGKHPALCFDYAGRNHRIAFPSTPGDWRSPLNSAADLRRLLRQAEQTQEGRPMSNAPVVFTVDDLRVVDDEPVVGDRALAERLGADHRAFRNLIYRYRPELESYGVLHLKDEKTGRRGRPEVEYLLSEPQAILLTIRSDAPLAPAARRALIEAFMAWRRGQIQPSEAAPAEAEDLLLGPQALRAIEVIVQQNSVPFAPSLTEEQMKAHLHTICQWIDKREAKLLRSFYGSREDLLRAVQALPKSPQIEDEIDVHQVYDAIGVAGPVPARASLSQRVGRSLDAYCKARRILVGSRTLLGQTATVWPRQAVLAWHTEVGQSLVARHFAKHAQQPSLQLVG